jgi:hypothetical protein
MLKIFNPEARNIRIAMAINSDCFASRAFGFITGALIGDSIGFGMNDVDQIVGKDRMD